MERILLVRDYIQNGFSQRETAHILHLSRGTVQKFLTGSPEEICTSKYKVTRECEYGIEKYVEYILDLVNQGLTPTQIYQLLKQNKGYTGKYRNFYVHLIKIAEAYGWQVNTKKKHSIHRKDNVQTISRTDIFNFIWNCIELSEEKRKFVFGKYPVLYELNQCVQEFRYLFKAGSIPLLHCFIERYSKSRFPAITSFARGLLSDIEAVENAVSTIWSNGFVEGTNNKLKTKKRIMFGRARRCLLEAKLCLL